jgi:adenine-specific DNA methylase
MLEWIEKQGLGRKEDPLRLLSRQVVYHLILKVMLYELVRERFALPPISSVSVKEVQRLFGLAFKKTGLNAFRESLLDDVIHNFDGKLSKELGDIADGVETVGANRADLIGRVYEDIIPGEERRKLGEYYTPRDIAEFMTRWAIRRKKDLVLDPACGSGTFLVESFYRLTELGCKPAEAIESLHGIDINPLAGLMSTVNLVARVASSRPEIRIADFLLFSSKQFKRFQSIVCNPPYSRHHELSQQYKEQIARQMDLESGRRISRLSSIYVHFFIHAASYLEEGGRMAFITPSEILDVDYAVELKQFILNHFTLRAVVIYPEQDLIFPGTLTTACITLLEKKRPSLEHRVVFVRVNKASEPRELLSVIEEEQRKNLSWAEVELIPQSDLKPEDKWSYTTSGTPNTEGLIPLRKIARVHRGVATGANEFFTLNKTEIEENKIEYRFLKPVIANARAIPNYNFTEDDFQDLARRGYKTWLLSCDKPKSELKSHSGLLRYLILGEKKEINKRYLTRARDLWYSQEKKTPAPIVFTYMSREKPRFVYNEAAALTLNTLHTIHLIRSVLDDKRKLKALLCYLNSRICRSFLRRTGRVYGGGLVKLEPREVENLPVIDIENVAEKDVSRLASLFDELCQASREGREDEIAKEIDDTLNRIIPHSFPQPVQMTL